MEGFFKGIGKGITGLVLKPVAGVMDGTSKISEGLKNNVTHFDDKPLEVIIYIISVKIKSS